MNRLAYISGSYSRPVYQVYCSSCGEGGVCTLRCLFWHQKDQIRYVPNVNMNTWTTGAESEVRQSLDVAMRDPDYTLITYPLPPDE